MIYVIKTATNDVIVFDSIASFSDTYKGNVSSHPIEDGAKISDHVITENPVININGVVSDYNFYNPLKDVVSQNVPAYKAPTSRSSSLTYINNGKVSTDKQSLPVDYSGSDTDGSFSVKASASAVKDKLVSIFTNKQPVSILAYDFAGQDSVITRYSDCIITSLAFNRNPESGYAIYPNITLEKITIVPVKVTSATAEKIIINKVSNQASGVDGKGNAQVPKKEVPDTDKNKAGSKQEVHINQQLNLEGAEERRQVLQDTLKELRAKNEAFK